MVDHWWRTKKLVSLLLKDKLKHIKSFTSLLEQKWIQVAQHPI